MNAFTIKDLENLSGIKAHTIRIWEQRYNFLKPCRTDTNIRYYSNDELKTVLNIALLNKYGFKISHIDKMQACEIKEKILSLGEPEAVQERIVNELVHEMVDIEMDNFEQILNRFIAARGIPRTVTQLIFPFLEKIGILWQTGHINAAQEHLVSNIIRQKLLVAIDGAASPVKTGKTFLLYLPEGELHELGLLFIYYMLKSRGTDVLYLGANVPLKDVEEVIGIKKPDMAYIHLTGTCATFNFERFIQHVHNRMGSIPTIISGQITQQYRKKTPSCVEFKQSLSEVMTFLTSY